MGSNSEKVFPLPKNFTSKICTSTTCSEFKCKYLEFKLLSALENSATLLLYTYSLLQDESSDCEKVTFIMKVTLTYYFS